MISIKYVSVVACLLLVSVFSLVGCSSDDPKGLWNDVFNAQTKLHQLAEKAEAVRTQIPETEQGNGAFVLLAQAQGIDEFFMNKSPSFAPTDIDTLLILVLMQAAGAEQDTLQEMIDSLDQSTEKKRELRNLAVQMKAEAKKLQDALKVVYQAVKANNVSEPVYNSYSEMRYYDAEDSQDGRPSFEAAAGPALVKADCPNQNAAIVVDLIDRITGQRLVSAAGIDPVQVEYAFTERTPVEIKIYPQANTRLGGALFCRISMTYSRHGQSAPKNFDLTDRQAIVDASLALESTYNDWNSELNNLASTSDPEISFDFLSALSTHKLRQTNRMMELFKFAETTQFFAQDKTEAQWLKDLSLSQIYQLQTIMGRRSRGLNALGRIIKLSDTYHSLIVVSLK